MNSNTARKGLIVVAVMFLAVCVFEVSAHARAGGGRTSGSIGSRGFSRPASPYSQPYRQQAAPAQGPYNTPYQQPAGGGFFRNMAGGIMGGMLGGMLFRSLGFGGMGGAGGGGIGLFEIILIAGIGYMIFRMVAKKRMAPVYNRNSNAQGDYQQSYDIPRQGFESQQSDVGTGLSHVRQMDSSFDESRFTDNVMDIFFKIQGAWMNRDLAPVATLLTDEMSRIFQGDIDGLLREKRVNRLENIAVRNVEVAEAWQEQGQDYITALIYANLLDYTTDDSTGQVVAGSKTEPVKFEEYWTFVRPVGNNPWRLSAIGQK
ncbi:MAG: Tim44 domain-containing protein [Geobacter sp.]|nr:Tim44 domain-containing protein [Geobacter sp.]